MKISIVVKKEFRSTSYLNDLEWRQYFYNNLVSFSHFNCEHCLFSYPSRLCQACIEKHKFEFINYHQAILEVPVEIITPFTELFSPYCHVNELV